MSVTNRFRTTASFQKLKNLYNEHFGYVSTLRKTPLYSDYLKLCKVGTEESIDTKVETISDLKIEKFKENLGFNPEELTADEKQEYEKRLELFDYSRSIYRKKLDYSEEGVYSPDFFRGVKQVDRDLSTNLNPTKDSIYKSEIYHNAAYIHMKKNLKIPGKIEIDTNFKNKWIKDYFQTTDTSSFLLNNFEGFTFQNDDYEFWRSDKKHSYLKTLVPHDRLFLFSKINYTFKGEYISVKFIPDFHPEVFLFKRSSPSVSIGYKHYGLRSSTLMKTEKIFRRLLWNEYSCLRKEYKIDIPEFYSMLGRHEIMPEGFAKKGHYIIQLNKTLEETTEELPKVRAEMKEAITMVSKLKWLDLFLECQQSKFTPGEIGAINKCLKAHKSPAFLMYTQNDT